MSGGHYFDTHPASDSSAGTVRLDLPDSSFTLRTDSGVFSPKRVDTGTKALLLTDAGGHSAPQHVLDVGCGYGPLTVALARRNPGARILAIDVNSRARDLCAANAIEHGLENVDVLAPGDVPDDIEFDQIWSNPPIRVGKTELHRILLTWLERLSTEGFARLVVNKNLGGDSLIRWLTDKGWDAARLSSTQGYRIVEVRRG